MANRIVGLDIGTHSLKAVVLELHRYAEVVDYREVELSDFAGDPLEEAEQDEASAEGPESGGPPPVPDDEEAPEEAGEGPIEFGGDELVPAWILALDRLRMELFFEDVSQIITCFPDGKAVTLHLDVPFEKPREVREILPHLLMDELPLSLREVVYDFIVVPGREPDLFEALVGFVRRYEMADFLGQCRQAEIDPAVVGVPELMLRYAAKGNIDPDVREYGIIDFGHTYTRLLVMSDDKPVVVHTTRRGGADITGVMSENFQIRKADARRLKHQEGAVGPATREGDRRMRQIAGTIEEALRPLVRDLRRTFQSAYAKYGVAVDAVYICGGTSRLEGMDAFLHGEFDVPVHRLRLDESVPWTVGAGQLARMPEATLAFACAMQRPLTESDADIIDFRQDEFVFRGKSSYLHQQMVRFGLIAAVLLVMTVAVLVIQYMDQRTQLRVMQQAVAEQTEELFGQPLTATSAIQARLEGEAAANREFVPRMSAYELMVRIMEQIDDDIPLKLDRIEVDTDRSLVQMVGETDSPQSVDVLASQIERLQCLRNVRKDQVNVRGEDQVQFELQISSGCS